MVYNTCTSPDESESQSSNEESNELCPESSAVLTVYSHFSKTQKRGIVFLTAFTTLFSPLSSFIYYPAIPFMANDLHVSIELMNLTITSYMVVSGIAPALLGDMADNLGRRPIYLGMLMVYVAANIALALQNSYPALLLLRMVQSFGSSATVAIAYGVVGDIASPAERGAYTGLIFCGPNLAPLLGPVLGGTIAQQLGWRWVFWFLAILSGTCFILLTLFFPETARGIVGNGNIPARGIHRTIVSFILPSKNSDTKTPTATKRKIRIPNPLTSIYTVFQKDAGLIMLVHGTFYMTFGCIQASLSSLLIKIYDLTGEQAGLAYLPVGTGCLLASYFTGKMLNRDYRLTAKSHSFVIDELRGDDLSRFPIENARLRSVWYLVILSALCIAGYGWSVDWKMNIAIPLTLQFLTGAATAGIFIALQTLLVDLHPDSPATAQAGLNLVRCALGACGLAVLQLVIDSVGPGWCFTLFAGVCLGTLPLLWMENEWGMEWRLAKGSPVSVEEELLLPA